MNDPIPSTDDDYDGAAFTPIYTAHVAVGGGGSAHGRATGRARSHDGALDLELRAPRELGGDATGANPEQLFAAALAASLHAVLSLLARRHSLDPAPITIGAAVAVGRDPAGGGFLLRTDVLVNWPGAARSTAAELLAEAAEACPYVKMSRAGAPATIRLAR
ncbi:OsmC family protein [Actinomadura macrotermitis]|uniref:Organic hydroperoxide resistance protein OhrB n=1 Tax=Actinomadura macrotermitis TaxID=2585200 RepID=A0A7K0BV83_9ACTN|nr:OsmC family protein [Actinomadura macrotermitis]MQY05088.1 Organic hydroperoxide resistance protein OhrB [Actinomadura macrotermitis]